MNKKWGSKLLAAMLSVSMLASLSVPSFAAKVIKKDSVAAQEITQEAKEVSSKKVIKKDSEKDTSETAPSSDEIADTNSSASQSAPASTTKGMKTYKMGTMQYQAPSDWLPMESESFTMMFSSLTDENTVMMLMAFDPSAMSREEDKEINSLYQTYAYSMFSAMEQADGATQQELAKMMNESIKESGGEITSTSFIKSDDYPGIKMNIKLAELDYIMTMLMGKKYNLFLIGYSTTDSGMEDVNVTLDKIAASVKTVK